MSLFTLQTKVASLSNKQLYVYEDTIDLWADKVIAGTEALRRGSKKLLRMEWMKRAAHTKEIHDQSNVQMVQGHDGVQRVH
jgi:hypothetical protein